MLFSHLSSFACDHGHRKILLVPSSLQSGGEGERYKVNRGCGLHTLRYPKRDFCTRVWLDSVKIVDCGQLLGGQQNPLSVVIKEEYSGGILSPQDSL